MNTMEQNVNFRLPRRHLLRLWTTMSFFGQHGSLWAMPAILTTTNGWPQPFLSSNIKWMYRQLVKARLSFVKWALRKMEKCPLSLFSVRVFTSFFITNFTLYIDAQSLHFQSDTTLRSIHHFPLLVLTSAESLLDAHIRAQTEKSSSSCPAVRTARSPLQEPEHKPSPSFVLNSHVGPSCRHCVCLCLCTSKWLSTGLLLLFFIVFLCIHQQEASGMATNPYFMLFFLKKIQNGSQ